MNRCKAPRSTSLPEYFHQAGALTPRDFIFRAIAIGSGYLSQYSSDAIYQATEALIFSTLWGTPNISPPGK